MLPFYNTLQRRSRKNTHGLLNRILVMVIFLLCSHLFTLPVSAQANLDRLEYYIDIDPGFGKATNVSGIGTTTNLADKVVAINPTSLTEGVHRLYVRARAGGNWSMTNSLLFYKPYGGGVSPPAPPAPTNITRIEYYFDADSGFGRATPVTFSAGTNIQNLIIPVNPTLLSEGVHRMYVRALNANGSWSLTNSLLFYKPYGGGVSPPVPPAPTNITRIEYYIDADSGFGRATPLTFSAGTNIQDAVIPVNPTLLSEGVHRLYVRALNANGNWSLTNMWVFYKPFSNGVSPAAPAIAKLSKLEYYIDTDPGYGKGIPVALDSITDVANYVVPINVSGLTVANHKLWVRALDKKGKWSMMNVKSFSIPAALAAPSIVVNSVTDKTICAKDSFDVSYHAKGTFNAGNVFNVELSDAAGAFGAAPTVIGSYTGIVSTIINAKLPAHIADGAGYRVRVSSTNPVVTGITGSDALVIHDAPVAQTITGASSVNTNTAYTYSVPAAAGSSWAWVMPTAAITPTANSASLVFTTAGTGQLIKVAETSQYGCRGDTSSKAINVYTPAISNVQVSTLTPCPGSPLTVTAKATGVYNATNVFTAQLSSSTGSFTTPVKIGSVTAGPVGSLQTVSINATMPYPLANGTGYRVRVIASSPSVTGSNNGQNLVVSKPNLPSTLTRSKCAVSGYDLTTVPTDATLNYTYFDNLFAAVGTPNNVDIGTYNIVGTNSNGCKDTIVVSVTNYSRPNLGNNITRSKCVGFGYDLRTSFVNATLTFTYFSSTFVPLSRPDSVNTGTYNVVATNSNGCKDTAGVTVTNYPKPNMPATLTKSKCASAGYNLTVNFTDATLTYTYFDNTFATVSTPASVNAGIYNVVGTNTSGCKDTTVVTVNNSGCSTPASPSSSGITGTSAVVKWRLVACAVRYELQYRVGATGAPTTVSVTDTSYTITGLTSSTAYQWRVRTVCLESPFTASAYTAYGNFTTGPGARGANEGDMTSVKLKSDWSASVDPNPANRASVLHIKGLMKEFTASLTTIEGKLLWQSQQVSTNSVPLPVEKLAAGVYLVIVSDGWQSKTLRLVLQR